MYANIPNDAYPLALSAASEAIVVGDMYYNIEHHIITIQCINIITLKRVRHLNTHTTTTTTIYTLNKDFVLGRILIWMEKQTVRSCKCRRYKELISRSAAPVYYTRTQVWKYIYIYTYNTRVFRDHICFRAI